jgi:GNAT superfamily N-acetyltransferase
MGDAALRKATEADDASMRAVIAAAFPGNPKARAEITAWQYWDNPFGRTQAFVWEDAGRVVATFAAFAMPAVLDGREATIGNGVDLAVDPAYRGRQLSAVLAEAVYAAAASEGMALTVSFINNPLAMKATGRAGWREIAKLAVWVLAVDDGFLASRLHVPTRTARVVRRAVWRPGRGPEADPSTVVTSGIDALWARSSAVTTGVTHTQAWWDWRFGRHPDRPYTYLSVESAGQLHAAAVATVREAFGGRFIYLLDLLADTSADARAIARAAVAMAGREEAVGVALMAIPGSRLAARATEAGFRRVPARLDPKPTSFGAAPHTGARPLRWSISWCDLDNI